MENLDTVILAGGLGTRLSEKTKKFQNQWFFRNDPILFHIIKYSKAGIKSFIICKVISTIS